MKTRFTGQEIIGLLKASEAGMPVNELCRMHGFSGASFYDWRATFGGTELSDARGAKACEVAKVRLKTLLVDATLDMEALKAVARGKALSR